MFNSLKLKAKKYLLSGYEYPDDVIWNTAIWLYKKFLIIHPNALTIWMQLGNSARDSGLYEAAATAYAKAMTINSRHSDLFLQMGRLEKKRGDVKRELSAYLQAKELDCSNPAIEQQLNTFNLNILRNLFNNSTPKEKFEDDTYKSSITESAKYSSTFKDVELFIELGLVANAEQHYKHYGYKQGRDILASLHESPPDKAIILCPSFGKRCGIGEHSRYLALSLEKNGIRVEKIRTTEQLLNLAPSTLHNSVVIVNHGPGLFDGFIPEMSEGEPTVRMISNLRYAFEQFGARPVVLTHTLFDIDNKEYEEFVSRQQLMMEMPVPMVTTIEAAARVFNIGHVEHGMQPLTKLYEFNATVANIDRPTIGFFGFLALGGKNYDALFNLLERIKGKLVGSVVTNSNDLPQIRKMLAERAIEENLGTGWIEDDELAERLSVADFHYLPHYDYDFWNNSGTARFAMNFGRPVIVPPHIPFLDLKDYAILADENDLPAMISHLRTSEAYINASNRAIAYAKSKPMTKEMVNLAFNLASVQTQISLGQISQPELTCLSELLQCNAQNFEARTKHFYNFDSHIQSTKPLSLDRRDQILHIAKSHPEISNFEFAPLPQIACWREHYELRNLYRKNAYECFVHVIRSLLKREPGLPDEVLVSQLLGLDITNTSLIISPQDFIKLVAGILGLDRAVPFTRSIQIYLNFEPIDRESLFDPNIVKQFSQDIATMLSYIADFGSVSKQVFGHINDFNIFACLLLPAKVCASRVAQATALNNDFESAVEKIMHSDIDIFRRFMAINNLVRESNKDLIDLMLLDWPIIGDSMISRHEYYANEFALFSGKELIFMAFRALLKREPTVFEQMNMEMFMGRYGRIQMLRHLSQSSSACARVMDIDQYDDLDLDRAAELIRPLVERFRSPIAGGWDLRNRYLIERRHASRSLLRLDRFKEDDYVRHGYSPHSDRQVIANIEKYAHHPA